MVYGRNIMLLSVVFLVSSLAANLISPVWPLYITSLGATVTELGFVFSMSNAVAGGILILSGFLSDKYGRKRLHALGTLLAAFPPLMYALAHGWTDLLPWVILSGLATGLYVPIRWVIVADDSSTRTMASAYSWTMISSLVGLTVGPFIGGVVADMLGIRAVFYICFMLMLSAVPITLLMQETRKKEQVNEANHKNRLHNSILLTVTLFSLINAIQGLGIGLTGPLIPVFVSNFNVDYTFLGMLYAIGVGVANIVTQIPGSKSSNLFDRRKVILVTFLASSPFFLFFAYSRNTLELIVFMFLSNAILGLSFPPFQTLMMDSTPSSKWGLINGIAAMTFWLGLMVGNVFSGILWDSWGMTVPFIFSALAIALSALPLLFLEETRGKQKQFLSA